MEAASEHRTTEPLYQAPSRPVRAASRGHQGAEFADDDRRERADRGHDRNRRDRHIDLRRARPRRDHPEVPGEGRLHQPKPDPGRADPRRDGGPRLPGQRPHRDRQDRRVPAADPGEAGRAGAAADGPDPGADPRIGHPDRPRVRAAQLRAEGVRRRRGGGRVDRPPAADARPGLPGGGRHPRPPDGPDGPPRHPPGQGQDGRPRRGRPDARHRVPARRRGDPPGRPRRPTDLAALGHDAERSSRAGQHVPQSIPRTSASFTRTRTRRSRRSASRT